jgi:hypothetical protein
MKIEEKRVSDFLKHRGYTDIVYEPDGKVPPDFLVEGHIAIEVRRLNQNHEATGARACGLEVVRIPLFHRIKKLVLSLGPPTQDQSWFVTFRFRRPVESWNTLRSKLLNELEGFMNAPTIGQTNWALGDGFELKIFPASNPHSTFFVMGGHIDRDSGGWIVAELIKNLRYCINEKTEKCTQNAKQSYPEWWLILVDHIAYGEIDEHDLSEIRTHLLIPGYWEKIILLSPIDSGRWREL